MKLTTWLLTVLLLSSCYTKQGAIRRFCQQDTARAEITVTVHDTVTVESIKHDTTFSSTIDTVTIVKDRLVIRYKKTGDQIHLSGEYKGDTIYRTKEVRIPVALPCDCPKSGPSKLQWIGFIILLVMAFILGCWLTKAATSPRPQ